MATRTRFICTAKKTEGNHQVIELRATKQSDKANTENPLVLDDAEAIRNQMQLRFLTSAADALFGLTKEVYVDFTAVS